MLFLFFVDKVPLKYTNWGPEEPDNSDDRACARFGIDNGFKWRAARCGTFLSSQSNVICQYGEKLNM